MFQTPVVPSLVGEQKDKDKLKTADGEDKPEDDPPVPSASNGEITKERTEIWREKKKTSPYADLSSVLVETTTMSVEHLVHFRHGQGWSDIYKKMSLMKLNPMD